MTDHNRKRDDGSVLKRHHNTFKFRRFINSDQACEESLTFNQKVTLKIIDLSKNNTKDRDPPQSGNILCWPFLSILQDNHTPLNGLAPKEI